MPASNVNQHVVICSNILWNIPTFRKYLIQSLIENGYRVSVVGSDENFSDSTISKLEELQVPTYIVPIDRSSGNPFKNLIYIFTLLRVFKKAKPDMVLFFTVKPNIFGSFACSILKIPFINTINGLGSGIINFNITSFFVKRLYRFALKRSKKVLFQNSEDRRFFIKHNLVPEAITGYVPGSGINTEEYTLPMKQFTGKRTFLLVGRLLKDKGVYEYIEAIRALKNENFSDVEFLMAGIVDDYNPSAVTVPEIESWEKLGLIRFLGKTDDIEAFFDLADFIVCPSYREGLSRLLLEAASCQKAIITTNVPGCRDIVEDGVNGFICEPRNSNSLKAAIIRGINTSNSELIQFGEKGRDIAKSKFNEAIVNKVYLDLIDESLSSK